MKGSPISPRPAAMAAHPHPAAADAMRPRRDAVQSLPSDLLADLLREAITKRLSDVGRTFYLVFEDDSRPNEGLKRFIILRRMA